MSLLRAIIEAVVINGGILLFFCIFLAGVRKYSSLEERNSNWFYRLFLVTFLFGATLAIYYFYSFIEHLL